MTVEGRWRSEARARVLPELRIAFFYSAAVSDPQLHSLRVGCLRERAALLAVRQQWRLALGDEPARHPAAGGPPVSGRLQIRDAALPDAPELARLIAAFREHLLARVPSDAEIRAQLPSALRDPSIEFACAWLDDVAVGFTQTRFVTSVWAAGLEAFLEDLFVVPNARRQSVGRSLLRHVLARAEARGARRFSLTTNERNESAHALYRSEGLAPVSHALYPGGREVLWSRNVGAAETAGAHWLALPGGRGPTVRCRDTEGAAADCGSVVPPPGGGLAGRGARF